MLKKLTLENFKNFKRVEVPLGSLTVLVGTNATGKSNLRDAFRFLHGISRGYSLADIIGEKWGEGGVLQWRGIRGGTREAVFKGADSFAIEVKFNMEDKEGNAREATYGIEVETGTNGKSPKVKSECLSVEYNALYVFEAHPFLQSDPLNLQVIVRPEADAGIYAPIIYYSNNRPVLTQINEHPEVANLPTAQSFVSQTIKVLSSMRFLDLAPDAMRVPSLPGQTLGDRGENLSSVLQAICEDPNRKKALIEWLRELTPMDAVDFAFPSDLTGKILVALEEKNGQVTSAHSASDGTLRFLGMLAALLGPEPARFYFLEELENGIHPTRLHLLLQLIESKAGQGGIQVVATSHSPQLLQFLSERARNDALLVYRLPDQPDGHVSRIVDLPSANTVLEKRNLADLYASGWMEDAVFFADGKEKG